MSNLQMIECLCQICEQQNRIIKAQAFILAELGATCMEAEIAEADKKLRYFLSDGEVPEFPVPEGGEKCS